MGEDLGFRRIHRQLLASGVGDAAAHLAHNTLTITGIAYGINSAHPNKVTTTDFKITADC
ncbi:lipoprotein LpqH [uncultured Mycobacterium sp.]|uniref:lipoprotein LpqH n=1 Tax=uncultured Mycobacterium sp. TaxID=171292 RepID=UPI0035CC1311